MKELAVTVRLRNNRLLERRERLGLSQKDLAYAAEVSFTHYAELERLRRSPIGGGNEWTEAARNLARFYEVSCEELFPDGLIQVSCPVQTRRIDVEELMRIGEGHVHGELPPSPDEALMEKELFEEVERVVSTLPEREQEVIRGRFGFDGYAKTMDEVARGLPVVAPKAGRRSKAKKGAPLTRETARRLEASALRKLRHPSRSKTLHARGGDRRC
jgi:transcriptional regulator with XRE-family HTH domain